MKTIYDLVLHETTTINETIGVLRVPGGWLYTLPNKEPVFISYIPDKLDLNRKRASIYPTKLINVLEDYFRLPKPITFKTREGNFALARQFFCYMMKKGSTLSNPEISKLMNYKNASHVINSKDKLTELLSVDKTTQIQYEEILIELKTR